MGWEGDEDAFMEVEEEEEGVIFTDPRRWGELQATQLSDMKRWLLENLGSTGSRADAYLRGTEGDIVASLATMARHVIQGQLHAGVAKTFAAPLLTRLLAARHRSQGAGANVVAAITTAVGGRRCAPWLEEVRKRAFAKVRLDSAQAVYLGTATSSATTPVPAPNFKPAPKGKKG